MRETMNTKQIFEVSAQNLGQNLPYKSRCIRNFVEKNYTENVY
jgi:hypothetical protein